MVIKLNYKAIIAVMISILICVNLLVFSKEKAMQGNSIEAEEKIIPIVMYHSILINNRRGASNTITPNELESDLKYIKENGYTTILMNDLIGFVNGRNQLPEKPIIITFDDGFLNNYVYVLPMLKKYDMKATLSIIGVCTDQFTLVRSNDLEYAHLSWYQVSEMVESERFEILNHTYNLHKSDEKRVGTKKKFGEALSLYDQIISDDIGGFQLQINDKIGYTPNTFVYPFGSMSKESVEILKKLGFEASLSTDGGINKISNNAGKLFGLKRNDRPHGMSSKSFFKKMYGISGMTE